MGCSDNLENPNRKINTFDKATQVETVQLYGQKMSAVGVYSLQHLRRVFEVYKDPTTVNNLHLRCSNLKKMRDTSEETLISIEWSKSGCNLGEGNSTFALEGTEIFLFKKENNILKSIQYKTRNLKVLLKDTQYQYQVFLELTVNSSDLGILSFNGTHEVFFSQNSLNAGDELEGRSLENSSDFEKDMKKFFDQYRSEKKLTEEELLLDPVYAQYLKQQKESASKSKVTTSNANYSDLLIDNVFSGTYNIDNAEILVTELDLEILIENYNRNSKDKRNTKTANHLKLMNTNKGTEGEGTKSVIAVNACGNSNGILEYELDYNKKSKDDDFFFLNNTDFLFQKNRNKLSQISCVKSQNPSVASLLKSFLRIQNQSGGGIVVK